MSNPPPESAPTATLPEIVREECRLLETVQANLRRLSQKQETPDHAAHLMSLRDSLDGEKLADDIASIVEAMNRTAALMAQQQQHERGQVDPDKPYFGRMVLDDDLGKRAILIGKHTFISDRVRIIDWRNAPISRVFYQYSEGDDYDEEIAGRSVQGEVLLRRTLSIADGRLRRVATDDATWVLTGSNGWRDLHGKSTRLEGGAGTAVRPQNLGTRASSARQDKHLPEIASLLDAEQFKLITQPDTGLVVIQGSAGSGKTTVGLHRIAYLNFMGPEHFRPSRMMVLVFSRALSAYISKVLPALGVDGVKVAQYERWAETLRKRHYRGLPGRYSDETPALVIRFKTHTAMLHMVDEIAHKRRFEHPRTVFDEMLTDRGWITDGLKRFAPGVFSEREVATIHRWCSDQFFLRDDAEDATDGEKPCLDREDDTILLRLYQVMKGPLSFNKDKRLLYDHIMVDEAQDLSPIELAVVIDTAGSRASVTLAGDVVQKVNELRDFQDWTQVLDALQLQHVNVSPLQVSYRATRPIMEVARHILGHLAPEEPLVVPRDGAPVAHLRFQGMGEATTWLAPALTELINREPTAYVALLTSSQAEASAWYQVLDRSEVPHIRLVDDQDFSFQPGIEVTDIRSSKGLEFDYVLILGADAVHFPNNDSARHMLHVGATRGAHQLWFISSGPPTPLLPDTLSGLEI